LLYAGGYRPGHALHHYRAIQALGLILGADRSADVEYLELCHKKPNIIGYGAAGTMGAPEADELAAFVVGLREAVVLGLRGHHPELLGAQDRAGGQMDGRRARSPGQVTRALSCW